jgi:hypothetical protein
VDVGEHLKVPDEDGLADNVPHNEGNCMVVTSSSFFSLDSVGVRPEQYGFGGAPVRHPAHSGAPADQEKGSERCGNQDKWNRRD